MSGPRPPTDPPLREDIATAVAAYDSAHPKARLPHSAVRLLTVMFAHEDVCQRSLEDLIAEGFERKTLSRALLRLQGTGFI